MTAADPETRVWHRLALVWFLVTVFAPVIALSAAAGQDGGGGPTSVAEPGYSLGAPRAAASAHRSPGRRGGGRGRWSGDFWPPPVLWRWQTGRKAWLRWLLLALAPVPPYVHALAWSAAAGAANHALQGSPGMSAWRGPPFSVAGGSRSWLSCPCRSAWPWWAWNRWK